MNEDKYEFDIEGNVEVKGQKSIQNVDKDIQKLADSVISAESGVRKLNEALSAIKSGVKPTLDLSEIEKAINAIDKRIDTALDASLGKFSNNMAQIASRNTPLRTSEGLLSKAEGVRAREREQARQNELRYQKMMSGVRSQNKSWSSFNPVQDEISAYKNQRSANITSMVQKTVALENKLSEANKTFDKFTDSIVSSFEKKIQEINRITEDKKYGFTLGASGPVTSGSMSKEAFRLQKYNNGATPLLLTSYAGVSKEVKETLEAEKKIKEAKEKEANSAEEAATIQENTTKEKKMTKYQEEKIRVADEKNATNAERNAIRAQEEANRKEKNDRLSGFYDYKSEHPDLFVAGANMRSKRYQTGRMFSEVGGHLSSLGTGGKIVGGLLDSLGVLVKSPVAGTATAISNLVKGVTDLGKSAVQAYAEIESIKTQLGVVFSNQTQADAMFGQISQYAVKSPFGVQQTSELAVLLKQSGVYASDLMDTLKMLGDTAGGNMEKMKRIANNYAQIVSIGKASMLDMRQFAYAGIPIFEAVSKELGVSQQELRKLISDGKVTSDIIEKVFKDLTGINGIFENATEKGAKTLKARIQNLSDARQLAFGSLGENFVGMGNEYGADSIGLNLVTTFENLYNWIHEHVDTKNIERDVDTIANSDKRIQELEKMLQYAKDTGDKDAQKMIEAALKAQKSIFDPDVQRSIFSESYDSKTRKRDAGRAQFGYLSEAGVNEKIDVYALKRDSAIERRAELNEKSKTEDLSKAELEELNQIRVQIEIYDQLIDELETYKKGIREANTLTAEELKANRERNIINAQQLQYDQASKLAGQEGSYTSAFEKLYSTYTSSAEYKQKKEEEEIKLLKEAQETLKGLSKYLDEEGNLNMTKMSYSQFSSLYNDKHAFDPSKKLTVTEGKSELQMTEDRKILTAQWEDMTKKITQELLNKRLYSVESEFSSVKNNYSLSGDNKQFFNNFDIILDKQLKVLESLVASASAEDKKYYQDMYNNLLASTIGFTVNDKGKEADVDSLLSNNSFIPLWKRILANATGLSTQGMTGTVQTLTNYRDDMAIRNMTADVLKATMRTMGVDSAMGLVKTAGDAKVLRGTTDAIFQVDWQATRKAVKDFALSLSASTDVVTAYKNSLQQELDTYEELIAAGYTQSESQDLKNQKTVSTKTLAKFSQDAGDQLVNAFGEGLKTASGKIAYFNGSNFIDEEGKELQEEEVIMTDKLFEFIRGELPRLREEIAKASDRTLDNQKLSELLTSVSGNYLSNKLLSLKGITDTSRYLVNDSAYMSEKFMNNIKTTRNVGLRKSLFEGMSDEDLFAKAMNIKPSDIKHAQEVIVNNKGIITTEEGKEAARIIELGKIIDNTIDKVYSSTEEFINSDDYKSLFNLLKTASRDEAVRQEVLKGSNYQTYGLADPTNLQPRYYEGARGLRNKLYEGFFGKELKADREDILVGTLRYDKDALANINANRKEDNQITEEDLKKDDAALLKMLSTSEKIALTLKAGADDFAEVVEELGSSLMNSLGDFGKGAFVKPFEKMAENLVIGKEATDGMEDVYKNLTAELLTASGAAMQKAGWELVARGAADDNYAMMAAGLGLAATGGIASGLGAGLTAKGDKDKKKDSEIDKLNKLKNNLADLLKQAREDAIYYENTLRHQKAISANDSFTRSVHDAIISPGGDIITTDPKDYLIATKKPQTLIGGGAPTINFSVIDKSTGVRVTQQRSTYNEQTNSIDFEAVIESKIVEVIASSKGDDAFAARDARLRGRSVIA